jgi:Rps23 Pro-64 3,4-dihydroxylase Tpa1-like proline 4-hydroxylase
MSSPRVASNPNFSRSETGLMNAAQPTTAAAVSDSTSTHDWTVPPSLVPSQVLDTERLMQIADARSAEYRRAQPFPHIALDGLFSDALLDQAVAELPAASARWTTYNTVNESKQVCSDASLFGPTAEIIVHALNSAPFVRFLERLTGIQGLIPDPHLHAAGYMKVSPGGFLGLHYDFATQRELKLDRRINVLLYLNRDWLSEWGGALELHSNDPVTDPRHKEVAIEPLFNRMAIFNTPNALHGHRKPLTCPKGRARLCLSWYYYTAPPVPGWAARSKAVEFRARMDPRRFAIKVANLLMPPIVFEAVRKVKERFGKGP